MDTSKQQSENRVVDANGKFAKGNRSGGRPKGSKNRLTPYSNDVARHFTVQDGDQLRHRFAGLEVQLAADREVACADLREKYKGLEPVAGDPSSFDFHQCSTRTLYSSMPAAFRLDEFVASWNGQ